MGNFQIGLGIVYIFISGLFLLFGLYAKSMKKYSPLERVTILFPLFLIYNFIVAGVINIWISQLR